MTTPKLLGEERSAASETRQRLADAYADVSARIYLIRRIARFSIAPGFVGQRADEIIEPYEIGLDHGEALAVLLAAASAKAEGQKRRLYELLTGPEFAVPGPTLEAYVRAVIDIGGDDGAGGGDDDNAGDGGAAADDGDEG